MTHVVRAFVFFFAGGLLIVNLYPPISDGSFALDPRESPDDAQAPSRVGSFRFIPTRFPSSVFGLDAAIRDRKVIRLPGPSLWFQIQSASNGGCTNGGFETPHTKTKKA